MLAELCGPVSGTVIDYCAGAGGKTLAIAAVSPNANFIACDTRAKALRQLEKRARRAGLAALKLHTFEPENPLQAQALTVFVDAPCSGLGTLRRHPELRLRLDAKTLRKVPALQATILQQASQHVLPGGRLIYGTCSILQQENQDIVQQFLVQNSNFKTIPESELSMAPHSHNTDGFYGIILHRTN